MYYEYDTGYYEPSGADIFFDEMGICFDFGFQIAEDYRGIVFRNEVKELIHFAKYADMRFFLCHYYQNDVAFAVRAYPWYRKPSSAELKDKMFELKYQNRYTKYKLAQNELSVL